MFLNFNTKDNAVSNLDAGIGASTTSLTVTLGQGAVFPSTNSILTLVQYNTPADPTSGVLKFEKVVMTSRSGDILTVTRGYDGTTATTFLSWDYIYLNVVSKVIEDIQDEVVRLEDDKLNSVGWLRTGLTANGIVSTDASGVEQVVIGWGFTPTGGVVAFAGSSSPSGYLICNWAAVSRSTYSALFSVIGGVYGIGDGSTTFNLPNLKGKVIAGIDTSQVEFDALGETGGAKTHTLTTSEMPTHHHWVLANAGGWVNSWSVQLDVWVSIPSATYTEFSSNWVYPIIQDNWEGQAHNNLQPYITLNYIIKV